MPQTDYSQDVSAGRAGLAIDAPEYVASGSADETMRFGIVGVYKSDDRSVVKAPRGGVCAVLEDAGAYTSGTCVIAINGVALSVAYDTDKATTFANIATAIQALSFVLTAAYSGNTLTITGEADVDITGVALSGFVGGVTITSYTYTTTDPLAGLVLRDDSLPYGTARRGGIVDKSVQTLSGDALNTSDTVDGYVNGVAIDTVTYATSEAVTLQLVCNALMELPGIDNATYSGRIITIVARPGKDLVVTLTVTDNALASVAPSFAGVYSQQAMPISETEAAYLPGESVNIVRKGRVWMRAEEVIALGDTVYVRTHATASNDGIGDLRNDTDSGTCQAISGLAFIEASTTDPDGNNIVKVEVNLP